MSPQKVREHQYNTQAYSTDSKTFLKCNCAKCNQLPVFLVISLHASHIKNTSQFWACFSFLQNMKIQQLLGLQEGKQIPCPNSRVAIQTLMLIWSITEMPSINPTNWKEHGLNYTIFFKKQTSFSNQVGGPSNSSNLETYLTAQVFVIHTRVSIKTVVPGVLDMLSPYVGSTSPNIVFTPFIC